MSGDEEDGAADYVDAWRNIDPDDPRAVARALAELGMQAGAKVATIEHMNERIGRALAALDAATDQLRALVPRAEMEAELRSLRNEVDAARARDRRTSLRRFVGLIVAGVLFAAVVVSAIWLNRLDIERDQAEDERFARRTETAAVCASTYPGDEAAIRLCIDTRMGQDR